MPLMSASKVLGPVFQSNFPGSEGQVTHLWAGYELRRLLAGKFRAGRGKAPGVVPKQTPGWDMPCLV